jgi:hypothetical protein
LFEKGRFRIGNADLGKKFVETRKTVEFRTLADEFEMISSRMQDGFQ